MRLIKHTMEPLGYAWRAFTIVWVACAAPALAHAGPMPDTPAIIAEKAELASWYKLVADNSVSCADDAFGKYETPDHTAFYPDSGDLVSETTPEARKVWADFCKNGGHHSNAYKIADIIVLTNAAVILGTGHYKRIEPDGTVSVNSDYSFTELAIRTPGGWKLRHSHNGVIMDYLKGK